MGTAGASAIELRVDRHRRRKRMQGQFAGAALEQDARRLHRQGRHGVCLAARRIERTRVGKAGHTYFPFHLRVIGLEFPIAERPIGESRPGDAAEGASFVKVDLVKTPEVRGEMRAAAADHSGIDQRVAYSRSFGRGTWVV